MSHYDRKGKPISSDEFYELLKLPDYKRVASTNGAGRWVSTVWLGVDHSFAGGPPLIFESMTFKVSSDGETDFHEIDSDRYSTEEEALKGHEEMCVQHVFLLDRIAKKLREADEACQT